jgi:hypothetical protein
MQIQITDTFFALYGSISKKFVKSCECSLHGNRYFLSVTNPVPFTLYISKKVFATKYSECKSIYLEGFLI